MIVINVDVAGNGRAGASSACVEAGNEPHQFFRCQLFHGAAKEMRRTGPWFVRQPLPMAGSWGQTCPPRAMGWTCRAAHRERALGNWSQISHWVHRTVGDSGIFDHSVGRCFYLTVV